jgi:hypothetical protein
MDRSDLYTPPKTHNSGAETWWAQVDFIIKYIQEDIAKKIEADSRYIMTPTGCICGREITAPLDFIAKHRAISIARGENE